MKYGAPLIIENVDGRTEVLKWVQPNSTVLEFGCAYGQMTQYLRENLGCKVYIVEYNPESFAEAMNYAEDGVCDDILSYTWLKKFEDLKFDYMLYTDVLEHLSQPLDVLKAAGRLLKDNGAILLSVPNVSHNDIVYSLIQGEFNYTPEGLLDETHVHLFSYASLKEMIKEAGFEAKEWKYTIKDTGHTEQYHGRIALRSDWQNILHERPYGEIYQFVVKIEKQSALSAREQETQIQFPLCTMIGNLYYDDGNGFNETDKYPVVSKLIEENTYQCNEVIHVDRDRISSLRFDMLEGQGCYLETLKIQIKSSNGEIKDQYNLNEAMLLTGNDPYILLPFGAVMNDLVAIEVVFIVEGHTMQQKLIREIGRLKETDISMKVQLSEMESNRLNIKELLDETQNHADQLLYEKDKLAAENKRLEETLMKTDDEKRQLEKMWMDLENSTAWHLVQFLRKIRRRIKNN